MSGQTDNLPDEPADFEESAAELASLPACEDSQNLKFEREDCTSFRTTEGLQRKAGVPINRLRHLVLKEIVDNALDTGTKVRIGHLGDHGFVIEDDGPSGIDGTPERIARMFSINRPMISTKFMRLPTRGALGNGLRVVTGAVLASGGKLVVVTEKWRKNVGEKKRRAAAKQTNWKDQLEIILMIEASAMIKVDDDDGDLAAIDPSVECLTVGVISQLADNVRDLPDIQRGTVCKKMSFLELIGRFRITMDDVTRMRIIDVSRVTFYPSGSPSVPDNFTIPRGQPGFLIPIEVEGGVASFPKQQGSVPCPEMTDEHKKIQVRLMRSLKAGNAATTD